MICYFPLRIENLRGNTLFILPCFFQENVRLSDRFFFLGVWHLAAEIRDFPLCEINPKDWHPVTATKGHGAMNLHIATRERDIDVNL